jgi:hypothetical protein
MCRSTIGLVVLFVVVIGAFLILVGGTYVHADSNSPPVEVHLLLDDDLLYMFECWPANLETTPKDVLIVYINYPDGIAGYQCEFDAGTWIQRILPNNSNRPVAYHPSY